MKTSITFLLFLLLAFFVAQSQTQNWQWAKRVGTVNDNNTSDPFNVTHNEKIADIKADKQGNVYAVGYFYPNPTFVNVTNGLPATGGYGNLDAYLIKYNSCGNVLWWRRMGGASGDDATSLVLDNNGKVMVLGYCATTFTLGGNNIQDTTIINIGGNVFMAKFDTSGNFVSINGYPNFPVANATDASKIFITSQGNYLLTNGVSSYITNTLGIVINTHSYATVSAGIYYPPRIVGITLDRNDNVYISGAFSKTINIGNGTILVPSTTLSPNNYWNNSLVAKFSPNGTMLWYKRSYNTLVGGDALNHGIALDTAQNTVMVGGGAVNGANVFGYTINSGNAPTGTVIYALDHSTGNLISAITGTPISGAAAINPQYTDIDNNIHCNGLIIGGVAFNTTTYTAVGQQQSCIAKLNGAGNFININMLPQSGSGAEEVRGLDMDEQGNIYIGGMFSGTLDSAGTAVNKIGGAEDGFIAKFGFPCGSTLTTLSPIPPTSLAAQYQATLTNHVTWIDNANYESSYELWYNINGAAVFSLLATLPANTTSYTHTGLSYNSNYCYKARAVNNIGASFFTNVGCAATPTNNSTGTAPNAPLNLTATNNGSLTNHVAWTDNSNDEDSFDLYFKIGAGSTANYSLLATLPANTTTYTHTGLSYTTTYCYKVAATNSAGSNYSNEACVSTPTLPTGIAEQNVLNYYTQIFPNPTSGEVMLRFPPLGAETDIEVINSLGEIIESIQHPAQKNVFINAVLIQLPKEKGLYFIKITAGTSRASVVKKVVVE
ncbi:MAG: T9SS type A sorting domain-containing protein [Bacteroidetes bacterium]|nr:T9SS type A sorting domain-containing protein [Bacteroidota bacterium]